MIDKAKTLSLIKKMPGKKPGINKSSKIFLKI